MTDQEAADALFDAVMEGRERENVTLEELRDEWAGRWPEVDGKTVYVSDGELYLMRPVEGDHGERIGYSSTLLGTPSTEVAHILFTRLTQYRRRVDEVERERDEWRKGTARIFDVLGCDDDEDPVEEATILLDKLEQAEAALAKCKADLQFIVDYTTSERERKAQRRAKQTEAERDEARRERDWMYEWFDNLYPRDVDRCLERYRAAHPEAGR